MKRKIVFSLIALFYLSLWFVAMYQMHIAVTNPSYHSYIAFWEMGLFLISTISLVFSLALWVVISEYTSFSSSFFSLKKGEMHTIIDFDYDHDSEWFTKASVLICINGINEWYRLPVEDLLEKNPRFLGENRTIWWDDTDNGRKIFIGEPGPDRFFKFHAHPLSASVELSPHQSICFVI